jgi:predicted outer membrane repeat protein
LLRVFSVNPDGEFFISNETNGHGGGVAAVAVVDNYDVEML